MNILLIGGTGIISSAITRQLAESGHELWLLNRGNRKAEVPAGVKHEPIHLYQLCLCLQQACCQSLYHRRDDAG